MTDQDAHDSLCAALAEGRHVCRHLTFTADTETPVSAWLKLAENGRGDFLLESVEGGRTRGRYSFIGLEPDLIFRATGDTAEINRNWRTDRNAFVAQAGSPLDALRELVAGIRMDTCVDVPSTLPFLVGYFGYETAALAEKLPIPTADSLGVPDMIFVRPGLLLVFDRLADTLTLIVPVYAETADPAKALQEADERLENAASRLAGPLPRHRQILPPSESPEPQAAVEPEQYREMIMRAKEYIRAGDIFQVVLAQRFSMPFALPPFQLYRALRRINPSPYLYHLDLPGFSIIGSSPEILVRARDGEITIRPIAGTRPRGRTPAEDEANRLSLLEDPKELAEHLMLLDLGRNDVGRVATAGSVTVTERFTVEHYSHVMHIVSNVVGHQRDDVDAIDAILAGFPAGTVSGAPKIRAMQIIAELEPERRGPYAGGIGYFSPDGGMDSCIMLRTAVVKDGIMHVTAGAGIVADSDPAGEAAECRHKAGALMAAARTAIAIAAEPGFGQ